ncbi:MAG: transcription termination factor NusA, partial [Phycisphaerales bacterium]
DPNPVDIFGMADRAEAFMPKSEQIPGEMFKPGDRIRCLVLDVRDAGSQVKIVLSRASPDFIRRLFEAEVPEVAERVIEIKALAREPGQRCKVAVASVDSKVDAKGACIGVRGSRIRNIVDEVNGEKIDIVLWNESSQVLISNAVRPAAVEEVSLCFELGRATIIVREDQLSLAIGKRGQNVRLAARLTGWDIDILTPPEFTKGLEILQETLRPIEGVNDEMLDKLGALGMISVFDIEEIGPAVLGAELGVTPDELVGRGEHLLDALGLPTRVPPHDRAALLAALRRDKKARGEVRFVLLEDVARPVVRPVDPALVARVLDGLAAA